MDALAWLKSVVRCGIEEKISDPQSTIGQKAGLIVGQFASAEAPGPGGRLSLQCICRRNSRSELGQACASARRAESALVQVRADAVPAKLEGALPGPVLSLSLSRSLSPSLWLVTARTCTAAAHPRPRPRRARVALGRPAERNRGGGREGGVLLRPVLSLSRFLSLSLSISLALSRCPTPQGE